MKNIRFELDRERKRDRKRRREDKKRGRNKRSELYRKR
jgi:hypothetical protein